MSRVPQDPAPRDEPADQPGPLTEVDRAILDFEREWWRFAGAKEAAIRERFGLTTAEYYRALGRLLDRDDAIGHDSLLVRRLRRQRLVRRRERSTRRLDRG